MRTDEFTFDLPPHLIAQHPPKLRGGSRLLHVAAGGTEHCLFADLPKLLQENDLLILNDTRVINARLFGKKESGGNIEVMVERILDGNEVLAQVRASKSPKRGGRLLLAECIEVTVLGRSGEFFHLRFEGEKTVVSLLEKYGQLPLPPYITHSADSEDSERYQTVFARQYGAVAAPTAGLHFDNAMLEILKKQGIKTAYVTLHVGAGTFQPVRVENVAEHVMHSERYSISQDVVDAIVQTKARGGRVVAVGTTSLRALESAANTGNCELQIGKLVAGDGETSIFITPGYQFKVVDALLTNFHLPKSTLLMLVCAFGGMDRMLAAYRVAVDNEYRFFSYGDAMLIERE